MAAGLAHKSVSNEPNDEANYYSPQPYEDDDTAHLTSSAAPTAYSNYPNNHPGRSTSAAPIARQASPTELAYNRDDASAHGVQPQYGQNPTRDYYSQSTGQYDPSNFGQGGFSRP